jgi:large subunit ribosomal protein L6
MSRIGRKPITVPQGVEVSVSGNTVNVKGKNGSLSLNVASPIVVKQDGTTITVERPNDERLNRSLHGLTRTLINNMIEGVQNGYSKSITIVGVGYRVADKGKDLEFQLGYSHPILFKAPEGISFKVESQTRFHVHGIDKQLVGETVAKIQKLRKADPYKGKGLHLDGARIRRKAGKAGKK